MTTLQGIQRARIALGVAGAALILGALMAWIKVSGPLGISFTVNGTDDTRDGWVTLVCGVIVIAVVLFLQSVPARSIVTGVIGLAALGVAVYDWSDVRDRIDKAQKASPTIHGSVGMGLWLTLFAAAAVVGLSIWLYKLDHAPAPDAEPPTSGLAVEG